jgi:hypothetical protein
MRTTNRSNGFRFLPITLILFLSILLSGCRAVERVLSGTTSDCPETEPAWVKPPADAAVSGPPAYGYYFLNEDRSIWASAWWEDAEVYMLRANEDIKVGWFRPAGAVLEITGHRLDGKAPPLESHVPCCYPTRFQATGLAFPEQGCWQVTAKAADSQIEFIVKVEPGS